MKFTAQEEYGLRCILHLARRAIAGEAEEPGSSVTLSEVATREGLSEPYAGKLFRVLAKAGLVEAERGRNGGYRLARPAEAISAAEVLDALGGKLYEPNLCDRFKGQRRFCVHTNDCSIRSLWAVLQLALDGVLSRTSLRDLVASEETMAQWLEPHVEALSAEAQNAEARSATENYGT